jgi:hypothetical protein
LEKRKKILAAWRTGQPILNRNRVRIQPFNLKKPQGLALLFSTLKVEH